MSKKYYCPKCHSIMGKGKTYKRTTYHYAGALLTERCCKQCSTQVADRDEAILYLDAAIMRIEETLEKKLGETNGMRSNNIYVSDPA